MSIDSGSYDKSRDTSPLHYTHKIFRFIEFKMEMDIARYMRGSIGLETGVDLSFLLLPLMPS